jgi:ribose/xylose/arabinose/galactoside ABC-type transport system permease subunit
MNNALKSIGGFFLRFGFIFALLVLMVVFTNSAKNFLTVDNFLNMMHTLAPTLIMISGLVFVVLTGAIDFSVGSIAFLSASIGTYLMVYKDVPPWLAVPVIVICGGLIGGFNGMIVEVFKVNPLITTFGTMLAFRGMGYLIAGAKYTPIPDSLVAIHDMRIGSVYLDIIISVGLVFLLYFIQRRTIFGKHLMALGNGRQIAEKLSINVRRLSFLAFVISGLFAGLGSIFNMAQGSFLSPRMGQGLEFTGIAIVVIGGISLFGGEGSILGLLLGVFTVYVIENGLQHIGLSPFVYPLLRGAIIFIAMYADSLKTRLRAKKLIRKET